MSLDEIRRAERVALLDTLARTDPGAPTLCAGWTVRELAAHLIVSERYLGLPLTVGYPLRRILPARARERAMAALQDMGTKQVKALDHREWDWSLRRLGRGSPLLYRLGFIAPIRLVEEWVHHEDIRRANGASARRNSPEAEEALWLAGRTLARLPEFTAGRHGIETRLPDGRCMRIGDPTRVRVEGATGELLLFLAGRTQHAEVRLRGDEGALRELVGGLSV